MPNPPRYLPGTSLLFFPREDGLPEDFSPYWPHGLDFSGRGDADQASPTDAPPPAQPASIQELWASMARRPGPSDTPFNLHRGPDQDYPPQPQPRAALSSRIRDGVQDLFDRAKGDAIGAGANLATRFQSVDDVISRIQQTVQGLHGDHQPQEQARAPDGYEVTPDQIRAIMPRAGDKADVFAPLISSMFRQYGIKTPAQKALFLSHVKHETGDLQDMRETIGPYSFKRLHGLWPAKFPIPESAVPFQNDKMKMANFAYNGVNGNVPGTDDGWNYRGGGLVHVTGRGNYRSVGYENDPDALSSPTGATEAAGRWWSNNRLPQDSIDPLNHEQFLAVSHRINKRKKEMEGRWPTYQQALKVLSQ